jgi:hypothetical protein
LVFPEEEVNGYYYEHDIDGQRYQFFGSRVSQPEFTIKIWALKSKYNS